MLSKESIKRAKNNFANYQREGLIKKVALNKNILAILTQNSEESLIEAQKTSSALWKIVMSYYSMFYIANAVLLKNGYKVGDQIAHKVTSDALIVLVKEKLNKELLENYEEARNQALSTMKADEIIQSFEYERAKRSKFQYTTTEKAKENKAQTSINRAKEFMLAMKKLL